MARRLEKFHVRILPLAPSYMGAHAEFYGKLKNFAIKILGCAIGSLGQPLTHVKKSDSVVPPKGLSIYCVQKNVYLGGLISTSITFFVDQSLPTFFTECAWGCS